MVEEKKKRTASTRVTRELLKRRRHAPSPPGATHTRACLERLPSTLKPSAHSTRLEPDRYVHTYHNTRALCWYPTLSNHAQPRKHTHTQNTNNNTHQIRAQVLDVLQQFGSFQSDLEEFLQVKDRKTISLTIHQHSPLNHLLTDYNPRHKHDSQELAERILDLQLSD
jgi:hypothetical protein